MRDNNELIHWGVKGQKWGQRRYQNKDGSLTPQGKKRYKSTGIRSALARRSNEKVDKSFKKWKEGSESRDNAIALGKKANEAKIAYERNKSDKGLKSAYRSANKEYKKALGENTLYRQGTVRKEVGRDASRKYLSEARKIQKQINSNPSDKSLQKKYNSLMSKHDVERAKARRAQEVGAKRSRKKAAIKRTFTMAAKTAVGTAAIAAGAYAANKYLTTHNVTIGGKRVKLGEQSVSKIAEYAKKARNMMGYMF